MTIEDRGKVYANGAANLVFAAAGVGNKITLTRQEFEDFLSSSFELGASAANTAGE